jgi:hypothetical protein
MLRYVLKHKLLNEFDINGKSIMYNIILYDIDLMELYFKYAVNYTNDDIKYFINTCLSLDKFDLLYKLPNLYAFIYNIKACEYSLLYNYQDDVIKSIIDAAESPDRLIPNNNNTWTHFKYACENNMLEIINYLIVSKLFDMNIRYENIYPICLTLNNFEIFKSVLHYCVILREIHDAIVCSSNLQCKRYYQDTIKYTGYEYNHITSAFNLPIYLDSQNLSLKISNEDLKCHAFSHGHLYIIEYLNTTMSLDSIIAGNRYIKFACYNNNVNIINYLINNNVKIDINELTLMHTAMKY